MRPYRQLLREACLMLWASGLFSDAELGALFFVAPGQIRSLMPETGAAGDVRALPHRSTRVELWPDAAGEPMLRLRRLGHVARLDPERAALLLAVLAQTVPHQAAALLSIYGPGHDEEAVLQLERGVAGALTELRLTSGGYEVAA